jgi:bifunctional DNA-binding transcriptional regulator/antitoxin component of YhaV-PrlF toxin-antitoxin module
MKIQKQLSKKIGEKSYHKYVIVLPEEIIEKSGFKEGDELKADVKKGEVRLRK